MRTITVSQMKKIEQRAERIGISPLLLMENAGRAVAETVLSFHPKRALVLAGSGNNGGDGFVAARHLLSAGVKVRVWLLGSFSKLRTPETRINAQALRRLDRSVISCLRSTKDLTRLKRDLLTADVVIDAMLGTGIRGELREPFFTVVQLVNSARKPVVAVDVPTGVDPTTGAIAGAAVRATITVSFHAVKRGLLKAREHAGEIRVASIGIPPNL